MPPPSAEVESRRVLIHAPRGRDADVVRQVLQAQQLQASVCATLDHFSTELRSGAGLAFVTEEALAQAGIESLSQWVAGQPTWSDFQFVVLASRRTGRRPSNATGLLKSLGNVMLLERPLNADTLVSAAQAALRARSRQYQTQRHLQAEAASRLAQQAAMAAAERAQQALAVALDASELGTFHYAVPRNAIELDARARAHLWIESSGDITIEQFYAQVHPEDLEGTQRAVQAAVDGADYDHSYRAQSSTGLLRWIRGKGRVYRNADGEPLSFAGVLIDIGRQKQIEAEHEALFTAEKEARVVAERAGRMKDEFLSALSHELRTPLSAILGWTHLLSRPDAGPADVAKAAQTIERNARAQARLIDDLLDVSRIAAGTLQLQLRPVEVATLLEAVVSSLAPAADARSITTACHAGRGVQPVLADPDRLQQIVWNLLANAIKFTPTGGRVALSARNAGADVVLQVSDNGAGITAEFLPHVFDRFRQAESSTARSFGGVGLGLAIVRQLTEMHGGSVTAASDGAGRGATFTVQLPAAILPQPRGLQAENRLQFPLSPAQPTPLEPRLSGLRILLVDDEDDGREMLTRLLQSQGAQVVAAASAEEAVRLLGSAPQDILISDIGMPKVDGYELLRRVRRCSSVGWHRIPAIALTAFARAEDAARARSAGFERHLSKPVEPAQLFSAIASLTCAHGPA